MRPPYTRELLTEAAAESSSWAELMRRLDAKPSGGMRIAVQKQISRHGIDVTHFAHRGPSLKHEGPGAPGQQTLRWPC